MSLTDQQRLAWLETTVYDLAEAICNMEVVAGGDYGAVRSPSVTAIRKITEHLKPLVPEFKWEPDIALAAATDEEKRSHVKGYRGKSGAEYEWKYGEVRKRHPLGIMRYNTSQVLTIPVEDAPAIAQLLSEKPA